jgi:hypothetical protein
MRITRLFPVAMVAVAVVAACSDTTEPVPAKSPSSADASFDATLARVARESIVRLKDDCDSASFNAVLGAGACVIAGGTTFSRFNFILTQLGTEPRWTNKPTTITVPTRGQFVAVNLGGEVHTFTRVANYGGGIVRRLSVSSPHRLSSFPTVATSESPSHRPAASSTNAAFTRGCAPTSLCNSSERWSRVSPPDTLWERGAGRPHP